MGLLGGLCPGDPSDSALPCSPEKREGGSEEWPRASEVLAISDEACKPRKGYSLRDASILILRG